MPLTVSSTQKSRPVIMQPLKNEQDQRVEENVFKEESEEEQHEFEEETKDHMESLHMRHLNKNYMEHLRVWR
jgi:hypothetical protein